jgi:hypothetical protein
MARFFAIAIVLGLSVPGLFSQTRSMTAGRPASSPAGMGERRPGMTLSGVSGHRAAIGFSAGEGRRQRSFHRTPFYGYGAPYFYSDNEESYQPEPLAGQPAEKSAPPVQVKNDPPPDPVLLELRGDRWVRVTNFGATTDSEPKPGISAPSPAKLQVEAAPALLVYRDGHTEEVSSYSIIGRMMYTKSDYWTSGSWTRSIRIADLDVPATLTQNQRRGVKFALPSGPDEVVIRP